MVKVEVREDGGVVEQGVQLINGVRGVVWGFMGLGAAFSMVKKQQFVFWKRVRCGGTTTPSTDGEVELTSCATRLASGEGWNEVGVETPKVNVSF